jgi:predicted nuclease with TOPRIM domain
MNIEKGSITAISNPKLLEMQNRIDRALRDKSSAEYAKNLTNIGVNIHRDDFTVEQIKKLKSKYDEAKFRRKELEKILIEQQVQIETLRDRVKELHDQKEQFRIELRREKKHNLKLDAKN